MATKYKLTDLYLLLFYSLVVIGLAFTKIPECCAIALILGLLTIGAWIDFFKEHK